MNRTLSSILSATVSVPRREYLGVLSSRCTLSVSSVGVLCPVYSLGVLCRCTPRCTLFSVYSVGVLCRCTLSGVLSRCTLSVYSVLQWIRRPAYIGPRPPSAPSKLSTSILYASAYVSAKTFHDAVPAGSIGKFHRASIASLCCYVITRL